MPDDSTIKTQGQKGDESTIPPVIDLRATGTAAGSGTTTGSGSGSATGAGSAQGQGGQGSSANPAATGTNPPAQTPVTAGTTQATRAQAAPKKPAGLNLEDEAMMAQSQTIMAPPEKYSVPSLVKEKFPDLVQLIKETESMNDQERDYWFQILPIMTEDQIKKFRDILVNEKTQLSRLDKEYEDELTRLNEKHMLEWKEFETKEKRKALVAAEQKSKDEERAAEEELLKRLSTP